MTFRTFSWFYRLGIMAAWPGLAPLLVALFALVLFVGWFYIPFARVGRNPDGSLQLHFGSHEETSDA